MGRRSLIQLQFQVPNVACVIVFRSTCERGWVVLIESHAEIRQRYFRYLLFILQGGWSAVQPTGQLASMWLNRFVSQGAVQGGSVGLLFMLMNSPVLAERATLLVDISDGRVIPAEKILRPSYPASLTKLITLYLLFEALQSGNLAIDSKLPISAEAAAQPAVKLGL